MDEMFFGFPPLSQALEKIASLEESQFQILRGAVTGPLGFDRNFARCKELVAQLGGRLDTSEMFNLLVSLRFFYDRSREWETSHRDLHDALEEFLELADLRKTLGEDPNSRG